MKNLSNQSIQSSEAFEDNEVADEAADTSTYEALIG